MTKELYIARVSVTGGRDGRARSEDGQLDVAMSLPKAIGGSGNGTNPEQLFAAGFAGCFTSSLKHAARQLGAQPDDISVDAAVTLTVDESGRYGLRVVLNPRLTGIDAEMRDSVVAEAERICAYTNATKGNVDLVIELA